MVNWRIHGLVFWCHEHVINLRFWHHHPSVYLFWIRRPYQTLSKMHLIKKVLTLLIVSQVLSDSRKKGEFCISINMSKNVFLIVHIVYLIDILFFLAKIFNIFTIVQFQNDDCISHTESPLVGTCYSSTGKYNFKLK